MNSNHAIAKSGAKLEATGVAESIDRQLDKEIENFIANSVSVKRMRKTQTQCTCSSISKFIMNKSTQLLPLVISLGYAVYVGYALYSSPKEAIAVTVFLPFVLFICINHVSKGLFFKRFNRPMKRLHIFLTPRKRVKLWIRRLITIGGVLGAIAALVLDIWNDFERYIPAGGLVILICLAVVFSKSRSKINWTTVTWGILLQFCLGFIILRWKVGYTAFLWVGAQVSSFLSYTDVGSKFVFGNKYTDHMIVFKILPTVIFFSAFVEVLSYVGAMQTVIKAIAAVLQFAMNTTPIESFATAAHIFLGQLESSVALKPFFLKLTTSELHAIMTSGFATIAGSLFAAMIEFGIPPEHLVSASFMSAPAALAVAKISIPETQQSNIRTQKDIKVPSGNSTNLIEALSVGSVSAIKLISYVVVNLISFMATLAFLDAVLAYLGARVGLPGLSFQGRSLVLGTYMLCGFGSLISIGIYLGALVSSVPQRKDEFSSLSLRGLIHGNIACLMTTCIAGLLYQPNNVPLAIGATSNISSYNTTMNLTSSL